MRIISYIKARIVGARRGLFAERVESRLSLRLMVLAFSCWVALSMGWLGSPLWIWLGGAILVGAGHAFSWHFRGSKSMVRSALVGAGVMAVLFLVPRTVALAASGDWLPAAHFAISGVIFFLVSQRALDPTFGAFLTGFTALFLAFLAMSFLVDQSRSAEVRWFQSRASFAWFWSAVLAASLAVSLLIFLVLPKQFSDPISSARAVVLPVRGGDIAAPLVDIPIPGAGGEALPITPSTAQESSNAAQQGTQDIGALDPSLANAEADADNETGKVQQDGTAASGGAGAGSEGPTGEFTDSDVDSSVVMQVRSPVLTYWRGQVYDTFDGRLWHVDRASWRTRSRGSAGRVLSAPRPFRAGGRPLYSPTYFLRQAVPPATVFNGYSPSTVTIPSDDEGALPVVEGAVYRATSIIPDYTTETLARERRGTGVGSRYRTIPDPMEELKHRLGKDQTRNRVSRP